MMRRIVFFALFSLPAVPSFAAFSSDSRGTAVATFLNLGAGARGAAMAGAQTAAAAGASGVAWNAAAPAQARTWEVEAMHGDWFQDATYNFAAAVVPLREGQALSVLYQQFSAGDLQGRDQFGFVEDSFEPKDVAGGLGFAASTAGLHWGATAKFIRSKIVDSASTAAVDLGLMSKEENGRRWGLAVTHLGGRLKYEGKEEDLPVVISGGGLKRWGRHSLTADLKFPRDNRPYVAAAGEAGLLLGEGMEGFARVGYSTRPGAEAGSLAGATVGAGLRLWWFSLDYAFAPFGDLGSVHVFSLVLRGATPASESSGGETPR